MGARLTPYGDGDGDAEGVADGAGLGEGLGLVTPLARAELDVLRFGVEIADGPTFAK